ncbi:MAG: ATP-binding protein [Candidatus Protistobacter heckmanni]|nr:ATP-binding protein [Candidatus Protistobacter heckmanni]
MVPNPVLLVRRSGYSVAYANPPVEVMLAVSRRVLGGLTLADLFREHAKLVQVIEEVAEQGYEAKRQDLTLESGTGRAAHETLHVHAIVAAFDTDPELVLIELLPNDQKIRTDREARILDLSVANKELIRNLAHEIKNPLGGIRGAAQLLELELQDRALREYMQVIIKESDRLQTLVDRLLEPHRHQHIESDVNIHEVLERVRSVVLAEFPQGLYVVRDYDASLPDLRGDKEQLIQTVLNIVHNAAQALSERIAAGDAVIRLSTRVARQVTVTGQHHKLALDLHIVDNGPGIPEPIRDKIFYPLVSGRDGGSGLGLTLAQSFVHQHGGVIECESRPGSTDFRILLPLPS